MITRKSCDLVDNFRISNTYPALPNASKANNASQSRILSDRVNNDTKPRPVKQAKRQNLLNSGGICELINELQPRQKTSRCGKTRKASQP
ncbi:hypothetical protein LNV08_00090 [Paucibacter sp. TC2R-5]|uniref:hypothetical protein n=1 Tax=Paucibacter sp. TC2R-5 TaxID=2893555 RepID=UPI0021E46B53|nr:hypothetical protein [Paucibacter sp. TC2R-5]MCV2357373.1 hypothetical protein [Paucibacter sp. TC2R-5]